MDFFYPDYYFEDIFGVTAAFLRQIGIEGIVLDVDNTLAEAGADKLPEESLGWINRLREAGIRMAIVSNGRLARVKPIADRLGLYVYADAGKPSKAGFIKAAAAMRLPPSKCGVVGDQIFTDVAGGKRAGMVTMLVQPVGIKEGAFVKLKRVFEAPIIALYRKKMEHW